jgi:ribokinase
MLTVFGSINLDISVRVARPPAPGETKLGGPQLMSPGGKGANQAHAARLFGAPVTMVGAVGRDMFADLALARLRDAGVDLSMVGVLDDRPTGIAIITVNDDGENAIIVVPGANAAACDSQVPDALLAATDVLLLQLEVPFDVGRRLARRARAHGCKVILNASPLPDPASLDLTAFDVVIVNQIEVAQIAAACTQSCATDPIELARALAGRWQCDVLVTLGSAGAALCRAQGEWITVPAYPVSVVDSTGAGDTFAGVFGAALALGAGEERAMKFAAIAGGLACTLPGAQHAQPTKEAITRCIDVFEEEIEFDGAKKTG